MNLLFFAAEKRDDKNLPVVVYAHIFLSAQIHDRERTDTNSIFLASAEIIYWAADE